MTLREPQRQGVSSNDDMGEDIFPDKDTNVSQKCMHFAWINAMNPGPEIKVYKELQPFSIILLHLDECIKEG